MTHPTRSRRFCLALAGLALTACEAPLAPADVAGTYALVAYAGHALPQSLSAVDVGHTIVADTLVLRADGTGTWIQVRDLAHPGETVPLRMNSPMPVRLRRASASLALDEAYPCDDSVDCKPWDSFRLQAAGEFLHLGRAPHVWSFRRVAP